MPFIKTEFLARSKELCIKMYSDISVFKRPLKFNQTLIRYCNKCNLRIICLPYDVRKDSRVVWGASKHRSWRHKSRLALVRALPSTTGVTNAGWHGQPKHDEWSSAPSFGINRLRTRYIENTTCGRRPSSRRRMSLLGFLKT